MPRDLTPRGRLRRDAVAAVIGKLDALAPAQRTQDALLVHANRWLRRRGHGAFEMDRKDLSRDLESMARWEARRWPDGRPSARAGVAPVGAAGRVGRESSRDRAVDASKDDEIAELKRALAAFGHLKLVDGYLEWAKANRLTP